MGNIIVRRYKNPQKIGYQGCIEDQEKSWICFVKLDGTPIFYLNRDKKTGAVK